MVRTTWRRPRPMRKRPFSSDHTPHALQLGVLLLQVSVCKCRLMISQILKMCLGCHPIIGARLPRVCDPRLPKSAIGWGLEAIQPKHVRESQAHLYVIPPIVLGGKIACWWSGRCVAGAVCLSVVACCPTGTYVCPPCTALPAVHRLSIVPRVLLGGIARWIGTVAG